MPSSPSADASTGDDASSTGAWRRVAAAMVALQGVVVSAFAIYYLAGTPRAFSTFNVLASAALFVLGGAGLLLVARGLHRGRRWARSPALTWQLLLLPVAYGLFQSGRWYIALPVAASALLTLRGVVPVVAEPR